MKVLMIGTDRKVFEEGSAVQKRMMEYAALFEEFHIIVFTQGRHGTQKISLGKNAFAHPTNTASRFLYPLSAYRLGKRILRSRGSSHWVISVQDPFETGIPGVLLKRKFGIPLQIQLHGDFGSPFFGKESFLNNIRLVIARWTLPRADCLRAVSKRVAKGVEARFSVKNRPVILPIITDAQMIKNAKINMDLHDKYPQFPCIVLMSSRLEKVKNVELALRAFQGVLKQHPESGLVILGEGTEKHKLEHIAKELGIGTQVVFEGWQQDVVSYLKTADLFLNTSDHEGYCLSLIEAGLSHCPIVTTNVGVVGEILETEHIRSCSPRDKKCITEALLSVLRDPKSAKARAEKVFAGIRAHSMTKEKYLIAYRDSLEHCTKKV